MSTIRICINKAMRPLPMRARWLQDFLLLLLATVLVLPVLAVLASWLQWDSASAGILAQMASTVLPGYAWTSLALCVAVAIGVAVVGTATAACVTLFDFPGRRSFEWALLLPLAMPAYVVAYAYTDFLQFGGPAQTWLRASFGWQGRVLPEIRNTPGATWVFVFSLYPYVYLLARTALGERAAHLMEAARLLGAPLRRRILQVALPLARPAVMAGVALALMETLADFGVASYFGIQTFTTGIYKAWLAMDNRVAAAQLATVLLAVVALLLALEHRAQRRLRFAATGAGRGGAAEAQPVPLHGSRCAAAWAVCGLPVLFGFVLPVLFMLRPLLWLSLPLAVAAHLRGHDMTHVFAKDPCTVTLHGASGAFREFVRYHDSPTVLESLLDLEFDGCTSCAEWGQIARGRVVFMTTNGSCLFNQIM